MCYPEDRVEKRDKLYISPRDWGMQRVCGVAREKGSFLEFWGWDVKLVCSSLCLPKETNQRKGPRVSCPAEGGMPGVYAPHGVLLDAAGALQTRCAQTVQIPFSAASPVLGCVPMGILFPPHLSCRASQTGAEKTRELFEGEARVFPRPALVEK
jgi:hypothetical protein